MVDAMSEIRFLLCQPWERRMLKGQNVFSFEGNLYTVLSSHRNLAEALEFSIQLKVMIARVSFPQTKSIDCESPYEFLGWENQSLPAATQPQA